MDETTIYTPDSNINITDNTVEHIIHNTRTIKIDRSKLLELYEKIAKLELPFYYKYKDTKLPTTRQKIIPQTGKND